MQFRPDEFSSLLITYPHLQQAYISFGDLEFWHIPVFRPTLIEWSATTFLHKKLGNNNVAKCPLLTTVRQTRSWVGSLLLGSSQEPEWVQASPVQKNFTVRMFEVPPKTNYHMQECYSLYWLLKSSAFHRAMASVMPQYTKHIFRY